MLAFAKDITQNDPHHPQEGQDADLKQYMDYQRKLNHKRIVYYSLEHGLNELKKNIKKVKRDPDKVQEYLEREFPLSLHFANTDTLNLMLKKMISSHNSTTNWYQLNGYYLAVYHDCMKAFIKHYNQLLVDLPSRAEVFYISDGELIDFDDWVYLYFHNLDFHIGKTLEGHQYPFAKRNEAIEKEIELEMQNGHTLKEALMALQESFNIDSIAIKVLLDSEIVGQDMELFHTPMENPIYEFLTAKQDASWESLEGETILDQAYSLGAQMKVWVWKRRKPKQRTAVDGG